MKQLFAVILTHGPEWQPSRPLEEQQAWGAHAAFMDSLEAEGFVLLAGPLGTEEALQIVRAESPDEIIERLASDPWAKLDLLRVSRVTSWTLRIGSLS
jgi:uncharacterized protein YciI